MRRDHQVSFEDMEQAAQAIGSHRPSSPRTMTIVDVAAYDDNWAKARARAERDDLQRLLADHFEDCRGLLNRKTLAQVSRQVLLQLEKLHDIFPNFTGAIAEVEGAVCRGLLRQTHELPELKLMLAGAPGLGKTAFVQAMADALGRTCHRISLGGKSAGFELKGLGRHWQSASPGAIAKVFARSTSANPIIVLDEIDKGRDSYTSSARSQDVILELAEPVNARVFHDEYLEVDIDASHAVIVAMANEIGCLSEALKSRFRIIEIDQPTPQQNSVIIRHIYSDLIRDDKAFDPHLSDAVVRLLESKTPRSARLDLINALGAAAHRIYRANPQAQKLIAIQPEDFKSVSGAAAKRRIGFVSGP
jgi:ATP-dependent Lon protease